jgi:uncharacterized Zn finger protein (UPF0148 family)
MRETQQCDKCKHYALYHMPSAGKTICARCQEIERSKVANASVKKNL